MSTHKLSEKPIREDVLQFPVILQPLHQLVARLKGGFLALLLEFTHQRLFPYCADEGTLVVAPVNRTAFQLIQALTAVLLCKIRSFLAFDRNRRRCLAEGLEAMCVEDGCGPHC